MSNNTLFLPLKAKWYDMIESGIKTEEYREFKEYWFKRLVEDGNFSTKEIRKFKDFDTITFVYGYTRRKMTFECKGIHLGTGNPEWGAEPGKEYFVIKLGRRRNEKTEKENKELLFTTL